MNLHLISVEGFAYHFDSDNPDVVKLYYDGSQ